MSRAKNPKYESMSLEELKANMEKSRQELEAAIHHKNILEQRKKLVERRERSHRLIVKGAEFEKVFPLSRDLEQEDVQDMMNQLQNSSYNKSIVRQAHIAALHKDQQQIAEAVKKTIQAVPELAESEAFKQLQGKYKIVIDGENIRVGE